MTTQPRAWLPGINQAAAELPPEIRMPDDCRLHQPMGTQNRKQHIRLHFTRMPGDAGTNNLRPERGGQNDHVCLLMADVEKGWALL